MKIAPIMSNCYNQNLAKHVNVNFTGCYSTGAALCVCACQDAVQGPFNQLTTLDSI